MSAWEATQICLGLTATFILAAHMFGTRFPGAGLCNLLRLSLFGPTPASTYTLGFAYAKVQNTDLAFAVLLPTLALAGYVAAVNRILELAQQEGCVASLFAKKGLSFG